MQPSSFEPLDLVGVGHGQVGPELLDVGVDLRIEYRRAAAVVPMFGDGIVCFGTAVLTCDFR